MRVESHFLFCLTAILIHTFQFLSTSLFFFFFYLDRIFGREKRDFYLPLPSCHPSLPHKLQSEGSSFTAVTGIILKVRENPSFSHYLLAHQRQFLTQIADA